MKAVFKNKRIKGIVSVIPEKESFFEDEIENYAFPARQSKRLKDIMGFEKHRLAKDETATSDLCVAGVNYVLEAGYLKKEEIGALVVVTITPDHFVPHVSNIVQGKVGLGTDVICMDIAQGCAGFVLGLMQSFMMLDYLDDKKVLLLNADVLSHKVSKYDRGSFPLVGDAGAVTVIENAPSNDIYFNIFNDGSRGEALIIPAGGSRMPSSAETAQWQDSDDGNRRTLENLHMSGQDVYNFVQSDAPPIIEECIEMAEKTKDEIEWFLFHQPNEFMLKKLADRLSVPHEKVPMNVVREFGNPSGASIPLAITHNLEAVLSENMQLCCLSAFGGGLCCAAMVMELGCFDFCEIIESIY